MNERRIASDGVELYVREDGAPDAPPLVLSNSLGTDLTMWEPQLPALAERYRVIRYDARGHGRSGASPAPYDLELLSRDALAVFDALGLERVRWCGLSQGGMVGQWIAINAPERLERAVIANAGVYIPAEAIQGRLAAVRERGLDGLVDEIVPRWFTDAFVASHPETVDDVKRVFVDNSPEGYLGSCAALGTLDHRATIGGVTVPLLVIGGLHDPATLPEHSEGLAAAVPGARLVMLDAAHLSNIERADEFTAAVLAFLDEA